MGDYLESLYNSYKALKDGVKPIGDKLGEASDYVSSLMPAPPQPVPNDVIAKKVSDAGSSVGNWLNSFMPGSNGDNSQDKVSPPKAEVDKNQDPIEAGYHPLSSKPDVDVKPDLMKENLDPRTLQTPATGPISLNDHNVVTDGPPGIMSQMPHVPDPVENLLASMGQQPPPMPTQGPMSPVPQGGMPGVDMPPSRMPAGGGMPHNVIDVGTNHLGSAKNLRDAQEAAATSELINRIGKSMDIASSGLARSAPSGQEMFDQGIKNSQNFVKDYQAQLEHQKFDPNSPESKAFRSYAKQLGITIKGDFSAADGEKILPMVFKNYELQKTTESKERMNREDITSREKIAKMGLEGRQAMMGQKMTDKDNTDFEKATKTVNADLASSRSAFGRNANVVRAAGALKQLVADTPNMNQWTESQVNEFAKNLDAMLSNGAGTVSGMKSFIPHSFMGDVKKFGSKAFNRPLGMDQGKFAQNLMNMVNAEEVFAKQNVQKTKGELLSGYEHLAAKYPDRWNRTFGEIGLDADSILNKKPGAGAGAPGSTPPPAANSVTIRRKSDGKTKMVPQDQAQAFLKNPDFEQVM
jgi:hypothetical protein